MVLITFWNKGLKMHERLVLKKLEKNERINIVQINNYATKSFDYLDIFVILLLLRWLTKY